MGFTEILTILLVALKATGYLPGWSWWLVFAPEMAAGLFYLIAIALVAGLGGQTAKTTRPLRYAVKKSGRVHR